MEWRVIGLNFLYAGLGVVLMFVGFAGQAYQALDIVDLRLLRELEHDDIPAPGLTIDTRNPARQVVKRFEHKDSIPLESRARSNVVDIPAIGANAFGKWLPLLRLAYGEYQATLLARRFLVAAHECRGHRSGGDHKRFGFKGAEQEREHEGDYYGFDSLAVGAAVGVVLRIGPVRLFPV